MKHFQLGVADAELVQWCTMTVVMKAVSVNWNTENQLTSSYCWICCRALVTLMACWDASNLNSDTWNIIIYTKLLHSNVHVSSVKCRLIRGGSGGSAVASILVCLPAWWPCVKSHWGWDSFKTDLGYQGDPAKNGYQVMLCEVKVTGVILTTSHIKCQLYSI